MRALLQRVTSASVSVDGALVGQIELGLLVLLGIAPTDTEAEVATLLNKIIQLRVFSDAAGKMNLNVQEVGGGILVVSQFTLYAELRKGNRPSFTAAAPPDQALHLYEHFVAELRKQFTGPVATGVFGAHMQVSLCNDGPVTIWMDTDDLKKPSNP
jgi:D-aminoacyl-tRNA deacylase